MRKPGAQSSGDIPKHSSQIEASPTRISAPNALAMLVLIAGTGFALWRADASEGYGPFAAIVAGGVWIAIWTFATLGPGRPLVRRLTGVNEWRWEHEVLAAIAGSAVLVLCAALLSVIGLFRPWPMLATALMWAVAGAVDTVRRPPPRPAIELRAGPLIGLAAIAALIATTVSPFYDQWHQHLGFPWIWLQNGSIQSLPHDWYSFMPVNSSLLFSYGLNTLGPWSAQLLHWWCGVVTVLAVALLGGRIGSRSSGIWAVWVLVTTPVVLHLATTAGSDLVVAMFSAGAWLALLKTKEDGEQGVRWWAFAGVCVGLAAGTKYIAFGSVAIPVATGALFLHRPWRGDVSVRIFVLHASTALATAVATFSPWAVRNFVATGNPLFPFANRLFASTLHLPADSAGGFSTTLSGFDASFRHIISGLDLGSFEASIDGFPSIGFVYIAIVVVVGLVWPILRKNPEVAPLAVGALVGVGFWLVTMHVSRYLVPVLIPLVAVLGASLAELRDRIPLKLRSGVVAIVGLLIAFNLAGSVTPIGYERLGASLGVIEIDGLLARWVSSTPAFAPVAALEDEAGVLLVGEARALGFERTVVFSDPYRDPLLLDLTRTSVGAEDLARRLQEMGVTHVLANRWEAVRSSQLRGHERFFVVGDPAVGDRLEDFCGRCLEPLWSDSGLYLYRLVPDCSETDQGGIDLAFW